MRAASAKYEIHAEWSPFNPQSICIHPGVAVSDARTVVRAEFPLTQHSIHLLRKNAGLKALNLAQMLEKIDLASAVLFSGTGSSFTVLGPSEPGEGGKRKLEFVNRIVQEFCVLHGIQTDGVQIIYGPVTRLSDDN